MTQPLTRQERIFSTEQTALLRQSEQLLCFNLKQLKTQSMTCSRPHVASAGPSRAGPVNPISWLGTKAVVDTDDSSIKPARTKVELLFFHLRQSKASWERKVASRRGARLCGHRSRGHVTAAFGKVRTRVSRRAASRDSRRGRPSPPFRPGPGRSDSVHVNDVIGFLVSVLLARRRGGPAPLP